MFKKPPVGDMITFKVVWSSLSQECTVVQTSSKSCPPVPGGVMSRRDVTFGTQGLRGPDHQGPVQNRTSDEESTERRLVVSRKTKTDCEGGSRNEGLSES